MFVRDVNVEVTKGMLLGPKLACLRALMMKRLLSRSPTSHLLPIMRSSAASAKHVCGCRTWSEGQNLARTASESTHDPPCQVRGWIRDAGADPLKAAVADDVPSDGPSVGALGSPISLRRVAARGRHGSSSSGCAHCAG